MSEWKSAIKRLRIGWRLFQERNRFVAPFRGLSLLDCHALVEVGECPNVSRRTLAATLGILDFSCSRLAARLESLGYAETTDSTVDGRSRLLRLSSHGEQALREFDEFANESLERICSDLTCVDLVQHRGFLKRFADGYKAPPSPSRANEHLLRGEIRRATRAMKLLEGSVFGLDGVSSAEWHILEAIAEEPETLRAADLCARFGLLRNSASVILDRLEKRKLIRRGKASRTDRRAKPIVLSSVGHEFLALIHHAATEQLTEATKDFRLEEVSSMADNLLQMVVSVRPEDQLLVQNRIVLRRIVTKRDKLAAEKLLQSAKSPSLNIESVTLSSRAGIVVSGREVIGVVWVANNGDTRSHFTVEALQEVQLRACFDYISRSPSAALVFCLSS